MMSRFMINSVKDEYVRTADLYHSLRTRSRHSQTGAQNAGASGLAPSPRPTGDAPGPTLWARCEAIEIAPFISAGNEASQGTAAAVRD